MCQINDMAWPSFCKIILSGPPLYSVDFNIYIVFVPFPFTIGPLGVLDANAVEDFHQSIDSGPLVPSSGQDSGDKSPAKTKPGECCRNYPGCTRECLCRSRPFLHDS